jgi:hypothetical protein
MEQRRLRLGDILDDYCPRERRVTNHAVVAMIEDDVKQTRCTTCDAEHPYKGGQAPRRKKKETPAALYKEVLAGRPDTEAPAQSSPTDEPETNLHPEYASHDEDFDADAAVDADAQSPRLDETSEVDLRDSVAAEGLEVEEGPVHRRLIRATLPRPEGQKDTRVPPEFTIRQSGNRSNSSTGQFRGNGRPKSRGTGTGTGGFGGGNGHRPHGGQRFAGARSGQGQGQGHGRGQGGGFRSAQQPRQGGGRKRSR